MPPMMMTTKRRLSTALLLLCAAFLDGLPSTQAQGNGRVSSSATARYPDLVHDCRVVDGDTLRCDIGRIRLLGIDAPELPGHCAQGRDCAPGDPYASSRSLAQGMGDGAVVRIRSVGTDRYGRTLAMVLGRGGDLSCWQLKRGQATYKPRWDNDGLVAATCPTVAD